VVRQNPRLCFVRQKNPSYRSSYIKKLHLPCTSNRTRSPGRVLTQLHCYLFKVNFQSISVWFLASYRRKSAHIWIIASACDSHRNILTSYPGKGRHRRRPCVPCKYHPSLRSWRCPEQCQGASRSSLTGVPLSLLPTLGAARESLDLAGSIQKRVGDDACGTVKVHHPVGNPKRKVWWI
jgi:hypothetical protein